MHAYGGGRKVEDADWMVPDLAELVHLQVFARSLVDQLLRDCGENVLGDP